MSSCARRARPWPAGSGPSRSRSEGRELLTTSWRRSGRSAARSESGGSAAARRQRRLFVRGGARATRCFGRARTRVYRGAGSAGPARGFRRARRAGDSAGGRRVARCRSAAPGSHARLRATSTRSRGSQAHRARGALACLDLASELLPLGAKLTVTHAFEGPTAHASAMALASVLPGPVLAAGLDRHVGLAHGSAASEPG